MGIAVTYIEISKNPVSTKENFKISVKVKEIVTEPVNHRLPFKLGSQKGNLK